MGLQPVAHNFRPRQYRPRTFPVADFGPRYKRFAAARCLWSPAGREASRLTPNNSQHQAGRRAARAAYRPGSGRGSLPHRADPAGCRALPRRDATSPPSGPRLHRRSNPTAQPEAPHESYPVAASRAIDSQEGQEPVVLTLRANALRLFLAPVPAVGPSPPLAR